MFNKPSALATPQDNLADRKSPRTTHTPGGYPPLRTESASAVGATVKTESTPQHTAQHTQAHTPQHAPQQRTPVAEPASSGSGTDADVQSDIGSSLIVGPDVKLKGAEILDCDTLIVEGRVEATMDSRVIRITERGSFSGKVGIDVAEIFGQFEGELTARQQLIIHATGHVKGKIRYGKLLIEAGGTLSGEIESIAEAKMAEVKAAANSAADATRNTAIRSPLPTAATN